MIIVTLVVTLASSMVWQQWRAVQVEVGERARIQSAWILSGALDWAKLILRENQRSNPNLDHLGQPWAVPLAESRLSTFLAADKDATTDDGPEAFLSGGITDAQGRFNLTDLIDGSKVDPAAYAALTRLCESLGLDAKIGVQIASGLASATAQNVSATVVSGSSSTTGVKTTGTTATGTSAGGGGVVGGADANGDPPPVSLPTREGPPPLLPRSLSQLAWLGVDASTIEALRPFVVVLPARTTTNVNTAPREVLAAEYDIDLGTAEQLVQLRQRTPFKTSGDFTSHLQNQPKRLAGVGSTYFEVRGRLRLNERVLEQRSLLQRQPNGQILVIDTERSAGYDEQRGS